MLFAPLWRSDDSLSCILQWDWQTSCSHCCSGFLWWRAEDPSLLRLRGHPTAPTSVNTHPLFCVRSNKPANLFKCCCPVITHTFLLRHSLDWDFSIDVWPDYLFQTWWQIKAALIQLIQFDLTGTKWLELDGNSLPKENDSGRSGRYGLVGILHRNGPLLFFIAFMSLNAKFFACGW